MIEPAEPHEALRHIAAACVLRPDSALFHLHLGTCYSTYRRTTWRCRPTSNRLRSTPIRPLRTNAMGLDLAKKKDKKGAIAAFKEVVSGSVRGSPSDPLPRNGPGRSGPPRRGRSGDRRCSRPIPLLG